MCVYVRRGTTCFTYHFLEISKHGRSWGAIVRSYLATQTGGKDFFMEMMVLEPYLQV
jgi:hypothetical protein